MKYIVETQPAFYVGDKNTPQSFEYWMRAVEHEAQTWKDYEKSWRFIDGVFVLGVYNGLESESWTEVARLVRV